VSAATRPRLLAEKCATCIFRPGNLMRPFNWRVRPRAITVLPEEVRSERVTQP
jgi:hypothetical protein